MTTILLEMEGVTVTRASNGRGRGVRYELDVAGGEPGYGVSLSLEQLEVLAQELPFIVASEKREEGGDIK